MDDLISRDFIKSLGGKCIAARDSKTHELLPISSIDALPSAQPEPQWIPCIEPPKESGTYIVTAYDGTDKRVTFVKYQKTLKRWDLTGARAYWRILAYKPLPEPWRGEET